MTPEQTARSIVERLQTAVDARDAEAMAACFAADPVLIGTAGYGVGDADVRSYLGAVAAAAELLHWHLSRYDVFLSGPGLLGFAAEGEIEWRDADGHGREPFRLTVVAVRDGQDWLVQHFHGSVRSD